MPLLTNPIVILALAALILAAWTINIAEEYERGVVFRLGRLIALKGPLANAAQIISTQPAALALRYMQTLLDMGSNQNSTIVFPIPIELIRPLLAAPVPMPAAAATIGALPVKPALAP